MDPKISGQVSFENNSFSQEELFDKNNKLDYLITGDNPTKNKLIKAKELKIKVLDQNEFNQLLK